MSIIFSPSPLPLKVARFQLDATRWHGAAVLWLVVCLVLGTFGYACSRLNSIRLQDFRAFYAAGEIVRHHGALLFNLEVQRETQDTLISPHYLLPFYHPAYEALLYAPLTLLSYRAAYLVYMAWNMLLLGACYLLAPHGLPDSITRTAKAPLFFLAVPLLICVFTGQNALLFLLALCLLYKRFEAGDDRVAGAILGLALFKLPIALPIAFLLTIRRGPRFLKGFLLTAFTVALISVALSGVSGTLDFLHLLKSAMLVSNHSVRAQKDAAVWLNAMPNLSGLLYVAGGRHLSGKVAFELNAVGSFLVFAACFYLIRRVKQEATAFSVAILCAVLLSPHLYIYDFAALLLPMLLLKHRAMWLVLTLWFVELPVLLVLGYLTWFSPAVVIPLVLLGICAASERRNGQESPWPGSEAQENAYIGPPGREVVKSTSFCGAD